MKSFLEGMAEDVSPLKYLIMWMGMAGFAAGLSLPKATIVEVSNILGIGSSGSLRGHA